MIKVKDIAYARLRSPDLDLMEEFLLNFGLVKVARTDRALYFRGTDPFHHIHVTEKGDPKFVGFAYHAASEEDLDRIAKAPGASGIEHLDEPGGGKRVRLTEPNGYQMEVVWGMEKVEPLPAPRQRVNSGSEPTARAGEMMRLPKGPSRVKRIGHGVMTTPKVKETVQWFRDNLGFICSDDVYAGSEENLIGSFNRCDAGDDFVDHHVFFAIHHERAGLNHISFEVQDIDDVFMGHRHMRDAEQIRAHVGHRPSPARQPGLRLLVRSVGPRPRALGRQRPAQRSQRRQPGLGRRGTDLAMGRSAARAVHRPHQRLDRGCIAAFDHARALSPRIFYGWRLCAAMTRPAVSLAQ